MPQPDESRVLVSLTRQTLHALRVRGTVVESGGEAILSDKPKVEALLASVAPELRSGAARVSAAVWGGEVAWHLSTETEAMLDRTEEAFRTVVAGQQVDRKFPFGYAVCSATDGSPVTPEGIDRWLLAYLHRDSLREASAQLAGLKIVAEESLPGGLLSVGAITAAVRAADSGSVVLWDLGVERSTFILVTPSGAEQIVPCSVGLDTVFEAIQVALKFKFRGAGERLFVNETYDFTEAGPKIGAALASRIREAFVMLSSPDGPPELACLGLTVRQGWFLREIAAAVGTTVWEPSADVLAKASGVSFAQEEIRAGLSVTSAGLLLVAGAPTGGPAWRPAWVEADAPEEQTTAFADEEPAEPERIIAQPIIAEVAPEPAPAPETKPPSFPPKPTPRAKPTLSAEPAASAPAERTKPSLKPTQGLTTPPIKPPVPAAGQTRPPIAVPQTRPPVVPTAPAPSGGPVPAFPVPGSPPPFEANPPPTTASAKPFFPAPGPAPTPGPEPAPAAGAAAESAEDAAAAAFPPADPTRPPSFSNPGFPVPPAGPKSAPSPAPPGGGLQPRGLPKVKGITQLPFEAAKTQPVVAEATAAGKRRTTFYIGALVAAALVFAGIAFILNARRERAEAYDLEQQEALAHRIADQRLKEEEKNAADAAEKARLELQAEVEKARKQTEESTRQAVLAQVEADRLARLPGTVLLATNPSGASVVIDSGPPTRSPVHAGGVAPGAHTVHIRLAGREPLDLPIDLKGSTTLDLGTVALQPAFGELDLTSVPDGLEFAVRPAADPNAAPVRTGRTPQQITDMPGGDFIVTFLRPECRDHTARVSVEKGRQSSASTQYVDGTLELASDPSGATVTLDGAFLGTTPLTIEKLTPKKTTLSLTLPGYDPTPVTADIPEGDTLRLSASLLRRDRVFTAGECKTLPRAIDSPAPSLSRDQRRSGAEVVLSLIVQRDGSVRELSVVSASDEEIARRCKAAVADWRFTPATAADGRTVDARIEIPFRFPAAGS